MAIIAQVIDLVRDDLKRQRKKFKGEAGAYLDVANEDMKEAWRNICKALKLAK